MRVLVTCVVLSTASVLLMSCDSNTPRGTAEIGESVGSVGSKTEAETPVIRDSVALPVRPGEPCYGAEPHSLHNLAAIADVPVWLPDAAAASEASFTGAWTCGGGIPLLTFGPVTVSYESGYGTPLDWERKARDSGGEVRTILGETGLVERATGAHIKGQVMVVINGNVLVRVLGEPSVPSEDLVAVADSIDLDDPI